MERSMLLSLTALLLFQLLENIISTVVGPSLIFYIESVGGTQEDYGMTTSATFLGMTIMMFYFGKWGKCRRIPKRCIYIISQE